MGAGLLAVVVCGSKTLAGQGFHVILKTAGAHRFQLPEIGPCMVPISRSANQASSAALSARTAA
jgi:hypothetical protein